MKTFKTKLGTELPLIDLRGKDYLQVAHRLVWFREEHPDWSITTEYVRLDENHAVVKATIANERGFIVATSHKCEDKKGFGDFIEKAETGAIGRALAACGFGTQFAPEMAEEHRIVDSPVNRSKQATEPQEQRVLAKDNGTHPSEAQLKRLFSIARTHGWADEDVKGYLGQIGLKSSKELNYFQYNTLCQKIEAFPKEPHHPA